MGLFEVRQYYVRDGKMDEWVEFMDTRIVPFVESKGMEPIALFRAEDDPNTFIWIRRFESEGHRRTCTVTSMKAKNGRLTSSR